MKNGKPLSPIAAFIAFALPNICLIPLISQIISDLCKPSVVTAGDIVGYVFLFVISASLIIPACIVGSPITYLIYLAYSDFFITPLLFVITIAMLIWADISAIFFKFGEFEEDSSYVTGHHYEVETHWDDRITVKKVDEYSGGGEWMLNIWIYASRVFLIIFFGIIIFLLHLYKLQANEDKKSKQIKFVCGVFFIGIVSLAIWGYNILYNPIVVFKNFHYKEIIFIYLLFIGFTLFFVGRFFKKIKILTKTLLLLGNGILLIIMIVGMTKNISTVNKITTVKEFEAIANMPSCHNSDTYELLCDIDFNGGASKTYGKIDSFKGTFNGNNHTIKNITITYNPISYDAYGFVKENHGKIQDIRFENICISVNEPQTNPGNKELRTGIVCGENSANIENCLIVNCSIYICNSYENCIGGISGYTSSFGIIRSCSVINSNKPLCIKQNDEAKCYVGGISGEAVSNRVIMEDIFTFQREFQSNITSMGFIGWFGSSSENIIIKDSYNCFGEYISYQDYKIKTENVYTAYTPIKLQDEIPNGLENWEYSAEFGFYIPCKNFK